MALAILLLIVIGVFPHHHHGEIACFVTERCEADKKINDEHTGHSEKDASLSCFAETEYMRSSSIDVSKSKILSYNPITKSSIFSLIAGILIFRSEKAASKVVQGEYLTFYKSAETSQFNGLRAPPYMHS